MKETKTSPRFFRPIFIAATSLHGVFLQGSYRLKILPALSELCKKFTLAQNLLNHSKCPLFLNRPYRMGITLVEILVSLAIVSLVMLPFILLFGVSEKITYKSINEVVASNLALQKIEELKSRPFQQLREIIESGAPDPLDGPFTEVTLPLEMNGNWNSFGVEYAREARVAFFPLVDPNPSAPDYEMQKRRIRVRVIVRFIERSVDGKRREKNFELATMVGDETFGAGLNASFPWAPVKP